MNIAIFEHAATRVKGGMEKVAIDIANAMLKRGHKSLLIADNEFPNSKPVFDFNPNIKVANIDIALGNITEKTLQILKEFKTDVFLIVYAGNNYLSALYDVIRLCDVPVVFSEHNNPYFLYWNAEQRDFRNAILSMGSGIHLLLDEYITSLPTGLKEICVTIANPVMPVAYPQKQQSGNDNKKLLYVGRISDYQKQLNLLIEAFALISKKFSNWLLELWGHGPDELKFRKQIKDKGIEKRAFLCGRSDNISQVYATGHLLCLPSLFEGFPLVVGEAHSYGIPVVGFSDCSGLNSLVINGKNGLLAEEMKASSLAKSLESLMADDTLREKMGDNAIENVKRFSPDKIFDQWETFLQEAVISDPTKPGSNEIDTTILSHKAFNKIHADIPFSPYPGHGSTEKMRNGIDISDRLVKTETIEDNITIEMSDLNRTIEREELLNSKLSTHIEAVYQSRSWRITAPLRWFKKIMREN